MKHSQFIEKMAKYKGTKKGNNFYWRHEHDPQLPEYGDLSHKSVVDASRFLKLSDMDTTRRELVKHFCVNPDGGIKPYPNGITKRILRLILTNSGLEWFEKKGHPLVHWKHINLLNP